MSETDAAEFLRQVSNDPTLAAAVVAAMKTAVSATSAEHGLDVTADDVDSVLAGAQKGTLDITFKRQPRNCWGWYEIDEF